MIFKNRIVYFHMKEFLGKNIKIYQNKIKKIQSFFVVLIENQIHKIV